MNNKLKTNIEKIQNIHEIINISNEIKELEIQFNNIYNDNSIDKFTKKLSMEKLNDKIISMKSKLEKGLFIECDDLRDSIINDIVNYLKSFGYKEEFILSRLENVKFVITNEKVISGGLLSALNKKINIDYTLAVFDQEGNFVKFKEDKEKFIRYVLIHEFLHLCSISDKKVSFTNDALSEGFTDLFAHAISKNHEDKSERYDFLVRVCTLFTNMIGIDKTLDDYINNLGDFSNLKQLFYEQGLDDNDFSEIYHILNEILDLQISGKDNAQLLTKKIEVIEKIKTKLFIPLLNSNENNQDMFINLFNSLFQEFSVACSLEEINKVIK